MLRLMQMLRHKGVKPPDPFPHRPFTPASNSSFGGDGMGWLGNWLRDRYIRRCRFTLTEAERTRLPCFLIIPIGPVAYHFPFRSLTTWSLHWPMQQNDGSSNPLPIAISKHWPVPSMCHLSLPGFSLRGGWWILLPAKNS